VTMSDSPDIVSFLRQVQSVCRSKAVFAVLPESVDQEVFQHIDAIVDDFVLWPLRGGELGQRLRRLLHCHSPGIAEVSEHITQELGLAQFVGQHPSFLKIVENMRVIARGGGPLVITGETGTGKELTARAVHHLSPRRDFPFIAVDCSLLPEHLVENELFGHARGAFTDAHTDQQGLVALANKGTLFLDEVDALPLRTQAKLLRFLQERTYRPLGSERFVHADVGVIAATNRDLEGCVTKQEFRSDLYYRLNVFRLKLPPLRDRVSDIYVLAQHFLHDFCGEGERKVLSAGALRKLEQHHWPGNVRELFNVVQQAVVFSKAKHIFPADIVLSGSPESGVDNSWSFREGRARAVEVFEKSFIEDLLRKNAGNVSRAAIEAQKDRRSFGRLIKKYKINRATL
jgi:two-component system response regulator GlrR